MPEFPEVYTITTELDSLIKNRIIEKVDIQKDYNVLPNNTTFLKAVTGKKVLKVEQIAKNIIINLEEDLFINVHLGMSGQLLAKKVNKVLRWERVTFTFSKDTSKDSKKVYLAYRSIRMFGKVQLLTKEEYEELKEKYGPQPLAKTLTLEKFYEIIKSKNTNIKNLLMDQSKIGGLGNIYATEALFLAEIEPERRTKDISKAEAEKLLKAVRNIIAEGIKNKGSTLEDELYVDIFGKKGQQQLYFKVYNQKNCPKCGGEIIKKKISGRNTYFCPRCQAPEKERKLL